MTTNTLYDTWYSRLMQMYTDWHKPQLGNMTALLMGIYLSHSVHLSQIANHIAGYASLVSITRRISRFLDGTGFWAPLIFVIGSNTTECHPVIGILIRQAVAAGGGDPGSY